MYSRLAPHDSVKKSLLIHLLKRKKKALRRKVSHAPPTAKVVAAKEAPKRKRAPASKASVNASPAVRIKTPLVPPKAKQEKVNSLLLQALLNKVVPATSSKAIHNELWSLAAKPNFARRRIFDARTALTLTSFGVSEFATANTKDFKGMGFPKVWNPLAGA